MSPATAAAILNVELTASAELVSAAYRRRARLLHPDRFMGAPEAEVREANAEFSRLNEAYAEMMAWAQGAPAREAAQPPPETPDQTPETYPSAGAEKPSATPSSPRPAAPAFTPGATRPAPPTRGSAPNKAAALAISGVLVVLVVVILTVAGLSNAGAGNASSGGEAAAAAAPVDTSTPDAASTPADTGMPSDYSAAGYTDAGAGLAWKWGQPTSCSSSTALSAQMGGSRVSCWTILVMEYQPCYGTLQASIDEETADGSTSRTLEGNLLTTLSGPRVIEFDTTDTGKFQGHLHNLSCV